MRSLLLIALVSVVLVSAVPAQNLLADPGFELGSLAIWQSFGNAFVTASSPPVDTTNSGVYAAKMFGNFNPTFDVTGVFQTFNCSPGDQYQLSCFSRHFSGDPITGAGMPTDNYSTMKIAFFDGNGAEITSAAAEVVILDGTMPTDTWMANAPITATAPIGATTVQALLLFLQPMIAGGAGYYDDVDFQLLTGGPLYPGTGDDVFLGSGINSLPNAADVKTAMGGDWLSVNVSSPGTSFDLFPYLLLAQLIGTSGGVGSVPGLPDLYLDLTLPVFVLVDPSLPGPFNTGLIGPGGGTTTFYGLPVALDGFNQSLVLQGLLLTAFANNAIYATTDAHQIMIP